MNNLNNFILTCVGSTKVIGDSLAPLIGSILTKIYNLPIFIYGTMDKPITAKNFHEYKNFITQTHPNTPIIAIDCALSDHYSCGDIVITPTPLIAGAVMGKRLIIGDITIKGIVGKHSDNPISTLNHVSTTELSTLALTIAHSIYLLYKKNKDSPNETDFLSIL